MFYKNEEGLLIPAGKTIRTKTETFIGIDTLPDWIKIREGDYDIVQPDDGTKGYFQGNVGDSSDDYKFRLGFIGGPDEDWWLDFNEIREVRFTFKSLNLSHAVDDTTDTLFGFVVTGNVGSGNKCYSGVQFHHEQIIFQSDNGEDQELYEIKYKPFSDDHTSFDRNRNLTFIFRADGVVGIMDNNSLVASAKVSDDFDFTTEDYPFSTRFYYEDGTDGGDLASDMWIRFSAVEMQLIHN